MATRKMKKPLIGDAFTSVQGEPAETMKAFAEELDYYGPRRFKRLIDDCRAMAVEIEESDVNAGLPEGFDELINESCEALSDWAKTHNEFAYFDSHPNYPGTYGFWVDTDSAIESADFQVSDRSELPTGATGLAVLVNDHGNVSAYRCSNGRTYELFAVV
ncbi:hypothetical protein Q669_29645 [Labrenzia sp. C1B10]|uniref:hypothetical protein n=1 Tax=unclassified Labrenzia TaxID=2648686 RepID=UPI0003B802AB|nr:MULTISPECIES: hypothetical protein [unclassified Labrenzia]ERP95735.1 hypothetical protein Q669_29645 [Labrenzia sp. C1B10]ERS05801.1 hypothetical protein Q675_29210 [Labrenzia sp. C1B70]